VSGQDARSAAHTARRWSVNRWSRGSAFEVLGETVTVKQLESGYFHLRGVGLCNWAQPPRWPLPPEELEAAFFGEAGERFRAAVRFENERLLEEAGYGG
jgi:hypothetical protein